MKGLIMSEPMNRRDFLSNSGLLLGGAMLSGPAVGNAAAVSRDPHDYVVVEGHRDIWELTDRLRLRVKSQDSPLADFLVPTLIEGGESVVIMPSGGDSLPQRSYLQPVLEGNMRTLDMLLREIEKTNGKASIIKTKADVPAGPNRDKVQFFLDLEGGEGLGTVCGPEPEFLAGYELALLRQYFRLGVRGVQLTHNGRNQLADGVEGGRMGGRLSPFGVEVVKEMNRLGMMIGVSHLSVNGVLNVAEITKHPIVSTHQNLAQFVSSNPPVEVVPEQVQAIASTGGIVGLRYMSEEETPYTLLADEVETLVKSIGVEHIGIGWLGEDVTHPETGYVPGFGPKREFTGHFAEPLRTHWATFIGILAERGFAEQQIGLILGGNYLRIWKQILPD
jgi:membrane dipeptidase